MEKEIDENPAEITCEYCGRHFNTEREGRCSCDFAEELAKADDNSNEQEVWFAENITFTE